MQKRTTVINLWGGPGCGKSTLAAAVFAELKAQALSCELVREFAKAIAWRGDKIGRWDELWLLGQQLKEESNLYGRVDWIITDRPLALSAVYARRYTPDGAWIEAAVLAVLAAQQEEGTRHIDLIVEREKPYVQAGRFESEAAAREVDAACRNWCLDQRRRLVGVRSVEDVLCEAGL